MCVFLYLNIYFDLSVVLQVKIGLHPSKLRYKNFKIFKNNFLYEQKKIVFVNLLRTLFFLFCLNMVEHYVEKY